jgi:hypothetical protein
MLRCAACAYRQLKLIPSEFQEEFIATPDTPWPDAETASKRVIGARSGNMTLILMEGAGHFVSFPAIFALFAPN